MLADRHLNSLAGIAAGLAASLLLAAPAVAQDSPVFVYGESNKENVRTERVGFGDLDLALNSGQKRLHHRVGAAVERVCVLDLGRDGLQDSGYYDCAADAWGGAAPQIALAVERAREIALTGESSIAATAITISAR